MGDQVGEHKPTNEDEHSSADDENDASHGGRYQDQSASDVGAPRLDQCQCEQSPRYLDWHHKHPERDSLR